MKKQQDYTLDNSVAVYIAGDLFYKVATGVATDFMHPKTKEERYLKNKLEKSAKEVQGICGPIYHFLRKHNIDLMGNKEVDKLIDIISDISSLDDQELRRVNGILTKIKEERRMRVSVIS